MFDEIKQTYDVPKSRVNFKRKTNMKKQKLVALSEPPLKAPQLLGNGLKKTKQKCKTHAPKRKIAEKDIDSDLSLEDETHISEHSTSKKRKHDITKIKNISMEKCNSGLNEIKIQDHDIDKLDEIILAAKKKEYDEKFKNDHNIEDVLFCENNDHSKKPNKAEKRKKCNDVGNEKCETELKNYVKKTKKEKKKLNESKDSEITNVEAENNVDKTNVKAENNVDKTNVKAENNVNKAPATNINSQKLKPNDKKRKDKLRKILELGNRNNIITNGNKLRDRMLERLKAAKFRYLNEKLYTSSGLEAQELFQSDPEAFQIYHEGYQQQLKKWPVNPLDLIIKRIEKMPKSHVIADMGCGKAELAARVPQTVHSFDLVAAAAGVRACDMAHTPLLAGSVDAAVYCLALMGTQLTQYLLEANRILKQGGTLLIAEVESRFTDAEAFARTLSRLGFQLRQLQRHRVFLLMELSKTGAPRRGRPPDLTLKPCLYKKR